MTRKPPPKKKAVKAPPAPVKPLGKKKPMKAKGKSKMPTLGGGLMGLGGTGASGMMPAFFIGFLILAIGASAATLSSNGSSADVQAKIGSAAAGDTITIPSGTFSGWNVNLSKAVTLQGAGTGKSIIKGNGTTTVLNVTTADNSGTTRLTGLSFDGGTTQSVMVRYSNGGAALIDHCEFIGGSASEMLHNEAYGPNTANKAKGWSNDVTPGSADAVYVEDCTFSKNPFEDQYFWGTSAMQSYYGARTVFRHNVCNYAQVDVHGTGGMIGGRWFEVYDNTFNLPSGGGNQSDYIVLRGGSGVVYGNKVGGGHNDGGGSINMYDENGGSSPLYTARGWNQNPSPIYVWANDSKMRVSGSDNVKENRDFFSSASQPATQKVWQTSTQNANSTYSFKPLTYPHPMAAGLPVPTPAPTATPAPSATPTPPSPSTKFKVGDHVQTNPNSANVRASAAGELVGTQPMGTAGTVTGGPDWGALSGSPGVFWWDIDFPTGADGFVGEDNLVKADGPVPTPTPSPTPPASVTYKEWTIKLNAEQTKWIESHPPYPDSE